MDRVGRRILTPLFDAFVHWIDRTWVEPNYVTALGFLLGIAGAVVAGLQFWSIALVLLLLSRLADGLDGSLARYRGAAGLPVSGAGGFLDICADFVVHGSLVLGVAFGVNQEFGASIWPFFLVLMSYYVNGSSLLAFSSIAERNKRQLDDGRSLSFLTSFAGASETIVMHSLWLLFPAYAWNLAIIWTVVVLTDALRQILVGYKILS